MYSTGWTKLYDTYNGTGTELTTWTELGIWERYGT